MADGKADSSPTREEDKALRDQDGFDFDRTCLDRRYETAGQIAAPAQPARSTSAAITGGAHGNYGTDGVCCGTGSRKREIGFDDLFVRPRRLATGC